MTVDLLRIRSAPFDVAALAYGPRRSRGVRIVCGHGYSSSKQNVDFLCAFLAGHGFAVTSIDFPGHKLGATGGTLRGVDDLMQSMNAAVAHARAQGDGPVYTMGHSMGAMTAILVAGADPSIAGCISIATGYGRPTAIAAMQRVGVTDFRSAYVQGPALPDLLSGSDERLRAALANLAGRPQLYIAATRDGMVSARSVEELFARAPEPKSFARVESDHTYAAEHSKAAVLEWLNARHPR